MHRAHTDTHTINFHEKYECSDFGVFLCNCTVYGIMLPLTQSTFFDVSGRSGLAADALRQNIAIFIDTMSSIKQ